MLRRRRPRRRRWTRARGGFGWGGVGRGGLDAAGGVGAGLAVPAPGGGSMLVGLMVLAVGDAMEWEGIGVRFQWRGWEYDANIGGDVD